MENRVLIKLSNTELIQIIKEEERRINELEKRMKKLDKIWRDYYRKKQYTKKELEGGIK